MDSNFPDRNNGTALTLRVDSSAPVQRSYLRFNVQGVVGTVTKATLRVYATNSSTVGYEVRSISGSWLETTVTYNTAPIIGATVVGTSPAFGAGTWTNVDVTSLVGGNGTIDLAMTPLGPTGVPFSSREATISSNAPQLVVSFGGSAQVGVAAAEAALATVGLPPDSLDTDGDGVPDADELLNGSDTTRADTDGDGLFDLWEIEAGLSPVDAAGANGAMGDPDGDGTPNFVEQRNGTDPFNGTDLPPDGNALPLFLPFVDKG